MHTSQYLRISIVATSFLVLAGCTFQPTTNTNAVINTNAANDNANIEVVANTNETVSNDNTNTTGESGEVDLSTDSSSEALAKEEASAEVDASDWLTYTNDEYGFSFRYPKNWSAGTNENNIGCISDRNIVCNTYSYGEGSFDDFPVEYVHGKTYVEESESFSTMTDEEILMTTAGKELMPLVDDEFLVVNGLPAYRSLRQLKKGELLRPMAQNSTERAEQTETEVEYRYVHSNSLIRLTFSIRGDNYENFYNIVDEIGQSFSL